MDLAQLDDVRRAARRLLLRRRRLLSALLLGTAVLAGIQTVAPPDPATVSVLVAARDLPAGQTLEAADLSTVALPEGAVPSGIVDTAYAQGRVTTGPIRRGEPLTEVRFVGEPILAGYAGLVAVPVRIPTPRPRRYCAPETTSTCSAPIPAAVTHDWSEATCQ